MNATTKPVLNEVSNWTKFKRRFIRERELWIISIIMYMTEARCVRYVIKKNLVFLQFAAEVLLGIMM